MGFIRTHNFAIIWQVPKRLIVVEENLLLNNWCVGSTLHLYWLKSLLESHMRISTTFVVGRLNSVSTYDSPTLLTHRMKQGFRANHIQDCIAMRTEKVISRCLSNNSKNWEPGRDRFNLFQKYMLVSKSGTTTDIESQEIICDWSQNERKVYLNSTI